VELTVAKLIEDAKAYFELDMKDEYGLVLEDPVAGGASDRPEDAFTPNAAALSEFTSSGLMGHRQLSPQTPVVWLRLLVDIIDGPVQVWNGPELSIMPEPVKLDLKERAVLSLAKKHRKKARSDCLWYGFFLVCLIIMVFGWVPTYDSYIVRRAIDTNLIGEDFSEDVVHFAKGFADVATADEMYEYMNDILIGGLGLDDGTGTIADNTRVVSGVRFRQQRVGVGEDAYCTVPDFAVNWTRKEDIICYPPFNTYSISKESFGPCGQLGAVPDTVGFNEDEEHSGFSNTEQVTGNGPCDIPPIPWDGFGEEPDYSALPFTERRWRYVEEWFGVSTVGQIPGTTYPSGGFSIYVGLSEANMTHAVAEMQAENWVDDQTRLMAVEILTYNQNLNIFIFIKILFEFDANGVCMPSVQYSPMVLEMYETDLVYQTAKIIYILYIIYFYRKFVQDMMNAREDYGSYIPFFVNGWNILDFIIYTLCLMFQVMGMVYFMSPSLWAFRIGHDQYQDMNSVAQYSVTIQNINAFTVVLSFLKLFKYLNLSAQFSLMTLTVVNVTTDIFVFCTMCGVIITSFAVSGNMLFGSEIQDYSTLLTTLNTMFRVMLGDFDYEELQTINALFAMVWFILFQVIVFMIMLNVFIAIISESFCEEHSMKRGSLQEEVSGLLNAIYKGIAHRTYKIPPDTNEGLPKPFFDPAADDMVRVRTVASQAQERKESYGGYSWTGGWASYRGLPSDSGTITARIHFPPS